MLNCGVQRDRHMTNNEWAMYTDCMDFWKACVSSTVYELTNHCTDAVRRNELLISLQNILLGSHADVEGTERSTLEEFNPKILTLLTPSFRNIISKESKHWSHYITRRGRQWSLGTGNKQLSRILSANEDLIPCMVQIGSAIRAKWPVVPLTTVRAGRELCKGSHRAN